MAAKGWSLRDLYRTLETAGTNRLRDAQAALDSAVRAAYGMKDDEDTLAFPLRINLELAAKDARGGIITPPGLPASVPNPADFVTADCITAPEMPAEARRASGVDVCSRRYPRAGRGGAGTRRAQLGGGLSAQTASRGRGGPNGQQDWVRGQYAKENAKVKS